MICLCIIRWRRRWWWCWWRRLHWNPPIVEGQLALYCTVCGGVSDRARDKPYERNCYREVLFQWFHRNTKTSCIYIRFGPERSTMTLTALPVARTSCLPRIWGNRKATQKWKVTSVQLSVPCCLHTGSVRQRSYVNVKGHLNEGRLPAKATQKPSSNKSEVTDIPE